MDEAEGFISKMDQRFKFEGDLLIQRLDAAFDAMRNDIKNMLTEYFIRKKCASVPEPVTEHVIQQEFSAPVLPDAVTLSYTMKKFPIVRHVLMPVFIKLSNKEIQELSIRIMQFPTCEMDEAKDFLTLRLIFKYLGFKFFDRGKKCCLSLPRKKMKRKWN